MALGADKPFLVLNSGIVDLMDAEELRFVIGHELGHVLSGHSVYNTMLYYLVMLANRLALVPFAWIGLKGVIWAPGGVAPQVRDVLRPGGPAGDPGRRGRPARADEDWPAARALPS